MIILPPFEDFLKACPMIPLVITKQAIAKEREILSDEIMDDETAQYAMTYAICEELLSTYHAWLGGQLASPDLVEL